MCTRLLFAFGLWILACPLAQAEPYRVASVATHATVGEALPMQLWFPAAHDQPGQAIAHGRFPLVLMSHGSGGSERGQRAFAEHLAAHGFIVAALRHWGDSYDRPRGAGTDVQLIGRPLQAKAALDSVLRDATVSASIDPGRIGMLGFSAGGYTTLVLAGGRPDFSRWKSHCKAHAAEDSVFCPTLVWRLLPLSTHSDWKIEHDSRIRAIVAMAPAGIFFDKEALAGITIPVRLYGAIDDDQTPNRWHAEHIAALLPTPVTVNLVPGSHYVFITPCSPELKAQESRICSDPPGVDRAAIQRQIGDELVTFFKSKL